MAEKVKDISYLPLENGILELPDTSYGFDNAPLLDRQIKVWGNREISRIQTFAVDIFGSSWAWDNTVRRIPPWLLWINKVYGTAKVANLLPWLWVITYTASLNYTTDNFNNDYIVKMPPMAVLEIFVQCFSATEFVTIQIDWSWVRYLRGNSLVMGQSNSHIIFMNSETRHQKINLAYGTTVSDIPRFWVFLRVTY